VLNALLTLLFCVWWVRLVVRFCGAAAKPSAVKLTALIVRTELAVRFNSTHFLKCAALLMTLLMFQTVQLYVPLSSRAIADVSCCFLLACLQLQMAEAPTRFARIADDVEVLNVSAARLAVVVVF
jgi:hypothetical protein